MKKYDIFSQIYYLVLKIILGLIFFVTFITYIIYNYSQKTFWNLFLFIFFFGSFFSISFSFATTISTYKDFILNREKHFSKLKSFKFFLKFPLNIIPITIFSFIVWEFNLYIENVPTNILISVLIFIPYVTKKQKISTDIFMVLIIYFSIFILKDYFPKDYKEPFEKFSYFAIENFDNWKNSIFFKSFMHLSFIKAILYTYLYFFLIKITFNISKIIIKNDNEATDNKKSEKLINIPE